MARSVLVGHADVVGGKNSWLVAGLAAAVALTCFGCGDSSEDDESAPGTATTAEPAVTDGFPDVPVENLISMEFDPETASTAEVLTVSITNGSDIDWSFECRSGVLSRWDGQAGDAIGSVIWRDDHLQVSERIAEPECTTPTELLAPGETEVRTLRLDATVDGDGRPLDLAPGAYQLLFPDREDFTGAIGQFVVVDD